MLFNSKKSKKVSVFETILIKLMILKKSSKMRDEISEFVYLSLNYINPLTYVFIVFLLGYSILHSLSNTMNDLSFLMKKQIKRY